MIRWKINKIKTSLLKKNLPTSFRDQRLRKFISFLPGKPYHFQFLTKKTSFLTKKEEGKNRGPRRTRLSSTHLWVFFWKIFYGCLWNSHHLQGWRYCPLWCRCHVILRCHHRRGRCHGWHHHPGRARGTGPRSWGLGGNFCWEESFHFQGHIFQAELFRKVKKGGVFWGVESWILYKVNTMVFGKSGEFFRGWTY